MIMAQVLAFVFIHVVSRPDSIRFVKLILRLNLRASRTVRVDLVAISIPSRCSANNFGASATARTRYALQKKGEPFGSMFLKKLGPGIGACQGPTRSLL